MKHYNKHQLIYKKGGFMKTLNFIKNFHKRKLEKYYASIEDGYTNGGDYITTQIAYTKEDFPFLVIHIQRAEDDGTLSKRGEYELQDRDKKIGFLKYFYHPTTDETGCFMTLGDIVIKEPYRNKGLGSAVLSLFEERAQEYGCLYITGKLSDVDADTQEARDLRDGFYIKHGYKILNNEIKKDLRIAKGLQT